ncbi:MAG: CRISPR-associated endonuclease Cas2 [Candidatus Melainabacteria bacterium HGW-Melainabacteria-1]|nr:MAG: CRISPR-associated endonuclease Cas2 [Candidatus Melainabacteria bacterium HGW-Melainabacteria-1]
MNILVCYDVSTEDNAGKRRLRKVAQICQDFGQRVQYSIFECRVNQAQYEELVHRLSKSVNEKSDSLRLYQLYGEREAVVEVIGLDKYLDFDDPLVL